MVERWLEEPSVGCSIHPRGTIDFSASNCYSHLEIMVGVAQSAEPQLVELAVAGSSPVAHPKILGLLC